MAFIKKDPSLKTVKEYVEKKLAGKKLDASPAYLYGLNEAVQMIRSHMESGGHFHIVGDYDVDGMSATFIMVRALAPRASYRIPRRFTEGFGLNEAIIDEAAAAMDPLSTMIITVDNGIAAIPAIKKAREYGFKVLVTDHHEGVRDKKGNLVLPEADLILAPNAEPEGLERPSGYRDLCGAGIAYRIAKELGRADEAVITAAGLATVCDMVPLPGENHVLVREALRLLNRKRGAALIRRLMKELSLESINEESFGFSIGPCMNAVSRLNDTGASTVTELMLRAEDDPETGVAYLTECNAQRKKAVEKAMVLAEAMVKERPVVLFIPDIGDGIIGLIAGRLCEEYQAPAVVFTNNGGRLKGSARSVDYIHIKDVLDKVSAEGLIVAHGGHAGAAGLTILPDDLERFRESFKKHCGAIRPKSQDIFYDLDLRVLQIPQVMQALAEMAPFGMGLPRPVFRYKAIMPDIRACGETGDSLMVNAMGMTCIGFHMYPKYEALGCPQSLDCVGTVIMDHYGGKPSCKMILIDFQAA